MKDAKSLKKIDLDVFLSYHKQSSPWKHFLELNDEIL
jgi:hypothetical protein